MNNKPYFHPETKHFMHFCHCGAWGSFGTNVNLKQAIEEKNPAKAGTWLCGKHWKEKNEQHHKN